ncbi:hypothetical protein [Azospirillum sp. sgz302134]
MGQKFTPVWGGTGKGGAPKEPAPNTRAEPRPAVGQGGPRPAVAQGKPRPAVAGADTDAESAAQDDDVRQSLRALKVMLDRGLMPPEVYEEERRAILARAGGMKNP